jgi:hypothetical protein
VRDRGVEQRGGRRPIACVGHAERSGYPTGAGARDVDVRASFEEKSDGVGARRVEVAPDGVAERVVTVDRARGPRRAR